MISEKSQNTPSPNVYTASKKEEIKILPAVVPVLGYTTTVPPNIYPPIEGGVQFVAGTQPTQPTSFPTTYQQGVSYLIKYTNIKDKKVFFLNEL